MDLKGATPHGSGDLPRFVPFSNWFHRLLFNLGLRRKLIISTALIPAVGILLILLFSTTAERKQNRLAVENRLTFTANELERRQLDILSHLAQFEGVVAGPVEKFAGDPVSLFPELKKILPRQMSLLLVREGRPLLSYPTLSPNSSLAASALKFSRSSQKSGWLYTPYGLYLARQRTLGDGSKLILLQDFNLGQYPVFSEESNVFLLLPGGLSENLVGSEGVLPRQVSEQFDRLVGRLSTTQFGKPEVESDYAFTARTLHLFTPEGEKTALLVVSASPFGFTQVLMERHILSLILVGSFLILLTLATGLALSRHLSSPLYRLIRRMEDIREHGYFVLEEDLPPPKDRDLHTLYEAFNFMLLSLQVKHQRLTELYNHLDEKVEERTRQYREEKQRAERTAEKLKRLTKELENAYERLEQYAIRLRRTSRAQTEFFTKVSHELRTPLNSIIGYSRLLMKNPTGNLTPQQLSDLATIYRNGMHLLEMVNELLDFSRIEAGKMKFEKRLTPVGPIIEGAVEVVKALAQEKGLRLEVTIEPDLPDIYVDELRIRQAVINLLSNAIKFTPEGWVRVKAFRQGEEILIQVADSGIGIPPDKLDKIFKEFVQFGDDLAGNLRGTGLGLPITKYLVEAHGGYITVESRVGHGSEFTIHLPTLSPERISAHFERLGSREEPERDPVADQPTGPQPTNGHQELSPAGGGREENRV